MEQGNTERKKLRSGYTTGSCAAGAAKAAVQLLLTGKAPASVALMTPKGVPLNLDVADWVLEGDSATCAIRKDSGDDPDITNGVLV
ncbi:MAG: cobalt-precorrin-5B (C(1))-methyltransferase, partial [Clostridiales bacterium]|nr:cobalt-precorrin-5B (C(1))-methyltransferase [Clostridiales bacterium]